MSVERWAEHDLGFVFDAAPDAIVGVDRQGIIIMANTQAEALSGYEHADLIGKPVELLVPDHLKAIHASHREAYFASRTRPMCVGVDLSGRRADGSQFPAEITLSSIDTEDGLIAIAAIRDFSDRRLEEEEEEEEVRRAREEAERSVKEEADRANQARGEFISRMSHEFRTPLNAILGFAQLLEMREESPEDKEAVAQILTAGRHLLDLINETLDIAGIDAGGLTRLLRPVDVGDVTREALDLMRPLAAERDIELQEGPAPGSSLVMADRQRLLQVMLNLLSNAVKYNRRGGSIKIVCESRPDTTRVSVTDTGYGIDPAKVAGPLFKPFERLGAEASGVEGTGLGLALSKSLIEAMGGHLGVSSKPDIGSTFWFRLPTAAERPEDREPSSELQAPVSLPVAPADILYIEDNLSNLQLLENVFLDRPQYRLMSAMTGRLGLQLARTCSPKVILLDLHLPDIGGEEVLAELRRDPKTRGIPVIVISADASPQTAKRVTSAGATSVVPKPLDLRQFMTVLSDALGDKPRVGIVDRSSPTAIEQATSTLRDLNLEDEDPE